VSLPKWANRDIHTKAEAQAVLDEVRTAIRGGSFDPRGRAPREVTPMTFRELSETFDHTSRVFCLHTFHVNGPASASASGRPAILSASLIWPW
jgi:hypothetical protein